MRSLQDFEAVRNLFNSGCNDSEISRLTGVPRGTVRDWRSGARDRTFRHSNSSEHRCGASHDFSTLPAQAYSYLLGMYLGDGYIADHPRGVYRLRIFTDIQYPGIIEECRVAMETVMPRQHAYRLRMQSRCIEVSMYSKHWPCLFPQHGPGRKHERPIELEPWQEQFVDQATESFVRGLIHSDGCRVIANDRVSKASGTTSQTDRRTSSNCFARPSIVWTSVGLDLTRRRSPSIGRFGGAAGSVHRAQTIRASPRGFEVGSEASSRSRVAVRQRSFPELRLPDPPDRAACPRSEMSRPPRCPPIPRALPFPRGSRGLRLERPV